jgi:nucleoside-diphosphate-sugar epimerase
MPFTFDSVLVTGGSGFIGSHTVDALLEKGAKVWVLDDLSTGSLLNLKRWKNDSKFHLTRGTVTNRRTVETLVRKVDSIIHLGAIVSPFISTRQPELTNRVNVDGTLNVLRTGLKGGIQRIVFASSSSVYGNTRRTRVSEDVPLNPTTPYGVSKMSAEKYCQVFYNTYGLETVSLRYFNVYGPRQSANPYSGVIAIFASRLLTGRRPIIYGDGNQTRDFINVEDVARANILALQSRRGFGEALNVGTGMATSVKALCYLLETITMTRHIPPVCVKERPSDIRDSCANISKTKTCLGFRPRVDLKTGLRSLVHSFQTRSA